MQRNFLYKSFHKWFCQMLSLLSPRLNTCYLYRVKFGRMPELERPRTLNEKLLKLKLEQYGKDLLIRQCSDKYAVRDYVRGAGCPEILNELLGVCSQVEEIDWEGLPQSFVIKWNFGCGYNLICPDKSALDMKAAASKLKKWGREAFWAYFSELQYRGIPKRLLVERYLKPEGGKALADYKFYCFHGTADCVMVCLGREQGWPGFYFFDRSWNLLRINLDSQNAPEGFTVPRPYNIKEAFAYADRLSSPFAFVRVDLYLTDGKIYFGELTFTPSAALDRSRLPETDRMFGDRLITEAYRKERQEQPVCH